jgi:hypothetical protein
MYSRLSRGKKRLALLPACAVFLAAVVGGCDGDGAGTNDTTEPDCAGTYLESFGEPGNDPAGGGPDWRPVFDEALAWFGANCEHEQHDDAVLLLRPGIYGVQVGPKSGSPGPLQPVSGLTVRGAGQSLTTLAFYSLEEGTLTGGDQAIFGWYLTDQHHVTFEDLTMDGTVSPNDLCPWFRNGAGAVCNQGGNGCEVQPDCDPWLSAYSKPHVMTLIAAEPSYENAVHHIYVDRCSFNNVIHAAIQSVNWVRDGQQLSDFHIYDSDFYNIGDHGIAMNLWRNSEVINSDFTYVGRSMSSGLGIDVAGGCENVEVRGNTVRWAMGGMKCEMELTSNGSSHNDPPTQNILFIDNDVADLYDDPSNPLFHPWYGMRLNCQDVTAERNTIVASSVYYAITTDQDARDVVIEHNTVLTPPSSGAVLVRGGAERVQVLSNTLGTESLLTERGVAIYGDTDGDVWDVLVEQNTIRAFLQGVIVLEGTHQICVRNNDIVGNPPFECLGDCSCPPEGLGSRDAQSRESVAAPQEDESSGR